MIFNLRKELKKQVFKTKKENRIFITRISLYFFNQNELYTLEDQILKIFLLLYALVLFINSAIDVFLGCPVAFIIIQFFESSLLLFLFIQSRSIKKTVQIKVVFFYP